MSNPPLRTNTLRPNGESVASGLRACKPFAGSIPATGEHAGGVDSVGDVTYRLERTTPTA